MSVLSHVGRGAVTDFASVVEDQNHDARDQHDADVVFDHTTVTPSLSFTSTNEMTPFRAFLVVILAPPRLIEKKAASANSPRAAKSTRF